MYYAAYVSVGSDRSDGPERTSNALAPAALVAADPHLGPGLTLSPRNIDLNNHSYKDR